jgi:uncharacterized SAM-binding protein YcdF (DUF218 family)
VTTTSTLSPARAGRRSSARFARGIVVALIGVLLLAPVLTAGYVMLVARQDDRTPTDAIVVLGAAQYWSRPSPVLQARLQHARSLYRDDVAPRVVTVGGNQPGDNTTEAQAAERWLTANGVPADDVVAVPTGSDTLTSLQAVAALMQRRGWSSATIVTDPAHEARSLAMSRALGIDAQSSPTQDGAGSALTAEAVIRETGGLLVFWGFQRWDVDQIVTPQGSRP